MRFPSDSYHQNHKAVHGYAEVLRFGAQVFGGQGGGVFCLNPMILELRLVMISLSRLSESAVC